MLDNNLRSTCQADFDRITVDYVLRKLWTSDISMHSCFNGICFFRIMRQLFARASVLLAYAFF
jgi:hypothetical protein